MRENKSNKWSTGLNFSLVNKIDTLLGLSSTTIPIEIEEWSKLETAKQFLYAVGYAYFEDELFIIVN